MTSREAQSADMTALATIAGKYSDGLTLTFDGHPAPTTKHYKCNTAPTFSVGDRVVCMRISGTWVVAFAVGAPK